MENLSTQPTHKVTIGGEVAYCNPTTYDSVVAPLVAKHGGVPKIEPITVAKATPRNVPDRSDVDSSGVSASGKARAERDEVMALENGFAPAPPLFAMGTRVVDLGVENARRSQLEHDAKPSAKEVCSDLVQQVRSEGRTDLPAVKVSELRMTEKGLIAFPNSHRIFSGARLPMDSKTFNGLFARLPCRSGQAYLNDCPPRLRSINFNHWAVELENRESDGEDPTTVVLRTRNVDGLQSAYAAVSEGYTPFDADKIGEALALAFPEEAKGVLDYDGTRVRVEGMWHSDVRPEEYVAGEIFKAGVIVSSDDTGGSSVRVQSVIWRNKCLNLIILDKNIGVDIRIKHVGSVVKLAARFREAFAKALTSVEGFANAWTFARREQGEILKAAVQGTTREDLGPLPIEAVLPGIMTGILERDLVPVRGRAKNVVPKLLEMHTQDEDAKAYGVSRASIVNAFTRYAHQIETDPFRADEIRRGAGALLSGHKGRQPAPLPYVTPAV